MKSTLVQVHFYNAEQFKSRRLCPFDWVAKALYHTLWRGEPAHCNIEIAGLIYDTCAQTGTHRLPARSYPLKPDLTVPVYVDAGPVWERAEILRHWSFQTWIAILDALGIWPASKPQPMHCAGLVAMALGVENHCRRPMDVLRSIEDGHVQFAKGQRHATAQSR